MNFLEFILISALSAILFALSLPRFHQKSYIGAATLTSHLQYAQILALTSDRHYLHLRDTSRLTSEFNVINPANLMMHVRQSLWQTQFHLGKIYSTFSYSIYIDTPRDATSTNLDSRPMAGDIIAQDSNRKCISGYNNTNTSTDCKDNLLINSRLGEYLRIHYFNVSTNTICNERDTARVYIDEFGRRFCAKIPQKMETPMQIIITQGNQTRFICIYPYGRITNSKSMCN